MPTKQTSLIAVTLLCYLVTLTVSHIQENPSGQVLAHDEGQTLPESADQNSAPAAGQTDQPNADHNSNTSSNKSLAEKLGAHFSKLLDKKPEKTSDFKKDNEPAMITLSVKKESYMFFGTSLVFRPHLHTKGVLIKEEGYKEYRYFFGGFFSFIQSEEIKVAYKIKGTGIQSEKFDVFGNKLEYEHNGVIYLQGPDVTNACERSEFVKSWIKKVKYSHKLFTVFIRVECADSEEATGFDIAVSSAKQPKHSNIDNGSQPTSAAAEAKGTTLTPENTGSADEKSNLVQDDGSSLKENVNAQNASTLEGQSTGNKEKVEAGQTTATNRLM